MSDHNNRIPNIKANCAVCGTYFEQYFRPSYLEKHPNPKCSPECYREAQKGKPRNKKGLQRIVCAECQAEFVGNPDQKYCSWDCQRSGLKKPEGRKRQDRLGYWIIRVDNHPNATHGGYWILEHRLIKERQLQREDPTSEFLLNGYLHPNCHVHHKNADPSDNREENLEALWPTEHHKLQKDHFRRLENTDDQKYCTGCNTTKPRTEFWKSVNGAGGTFTYCIECGNERNRIAREKRRSIH